MVNRKGELLCPKRKLRESSQLLLYARQPALAGAAGYYYNQSMVPKKHDPHNDNDPLEQPYTSGRHWMNEHVRRQDVFTISEDGLQLHGTCSCTGISFSRAIRTATATRSACMTSMIPRKSWAFSRGITMKSVA